MLGLAAALSIIRGVRVDVDAEGDTKPGTFIRVIFPVSIILGFNIITVSAADNSKINVIFDLCPVNLSLGIGYVNAFFCYLSDCSLCFPPFI